MTLRHRYRTVVFGWSNRLEFIQLWLGAECVSSSSGDGRLHVNVEILDNRLRRRMVRKLSLIANCVPSNVRFRQRFACGADLKFIRRA